MVDMKLLKARGISSGAYKKIFTAEPADYPTKIKQLVNILSRRLRDGRMMNLTEARAYAAIDLAYDVPFNQTTPTILNNILCQRLDEKGTVEALRAWGLKEEELFLKVPLPDKAGYGLIPNPPVFFQIFVPLVKAYVTMRLAKIFNERNLPDLLKYEPLHDTARNQVLCEIMTDVATTISNWYGYPSVLRQAIQQMLKYGVMLAFTREEWHHEQQIVYDDAGGETAVTAKEGLRYIMPHPTRMFYDLLYPLTTLNSDSGCEYAGHWQVMRYGDILDDQKYWNRTQIFCGTNWFLAPYVGNFFTEVYPCTLKFPAVSWGTVNREDRAAWYTSNSRDHAVFVTAFFMKLVPQHWGLGEYVGGKLMKSYNQPVWHKFILAGDDTIIFAEPCAYNPIWFMGYDYDEQAGRNPSLALETIPWQDHVGNILTQIILTAQQNLANFTFYDTNIVNKDDIDRAKNLGSRLYRGMNFIGYDSTMIQRIGLNPQAAFIPAQLSKQNIQELFQVLPIVLQMLERVIQVSAQEVGSAATHQQSKYELQQIGGASTNRVIFTSSFVDDGMDAWKRQIHQGSLAYLDPEISAEVSYDIPGIEQHLQELGFKVTGIGRQSFLVKGNKKALRLEAFSSSNAGPQPTHERELSQIIFQTVTAVSTRPELFNAIGAKNVIALLEQGAKLGGAPRDFKLNLMVQGQSPQDIPPAIMEAIKQAQAATLQTVQENLAKPVAKDIAEDQQQLQMIQSAIQQLGKIYEVAAANQDKNRIAAEKAAADQQRKDMALAKSEQRKDVAAQAQIQRDDAKAAAEIQRETAKAQSQAEIDAAQAAQKIELDRKAAAAKP